MFEYIHSSFPEWKRSPEYPIFFNFCAKSSFLTKKCSSLGVDCHVDYLNDKKYTIFFNFCSKSSFSQKKNVALKGLIATLTFIHSSFPDRKRSPQYPIFYEMKSSLKLVIIFELFESVVGFEYICSSFPDRKRSPEYPIFSEMKYSLKWSLLSGSTWIFFVFKLGLISSRPPYEAQVYMSLFAAYILM